MILPKWRQVIVHGVSIYWTERQLTFFLLHKKNHYALQLDPFNSCCRVRSPGLAVELTLFAQKIILMLCNKQQDLPSYQ